MKRNFAFTLVEILIVILIIMILAGITTIVVAPSVAKAKTAPACASNLKQISVAYNIYMADNDGGLPRYSLVQDALYGVPGMQNAALVAVSRCPLAGDTYWDNVLSARVSMQKPPRYSQLWNGDPIPIFDVELDVLYRCLNHGYGDYDRRARPGFGRWDTCKTGPVLGVRLNGTVRKVHKNSCWEFGYIESTPSTACPTRSDATGCDRPAN